MLPKVYSKQVPSQPRRPLPIYKQEKDLMHLAASQRWPFRLMGVAPVPATAVYYNGLWLVPQTQDHTALPPFALERMRAIERTGIKPKAYVVVHEAPKQLAPPANVRIISPQEYWTDQAARYSLAAAKVSGTMIAAAVTVLAPIVLTTLGIMVLGSLSLLAGVDPILVAVTDQDVWIEIARWRN